MYQSTTIHSIVCIQVQPRGHILQTNQCRTHTYVYGPDSSTSQCVCSEKKAYPSRQFWVEQYDSWKGRDNNNGPIPSSNATKFDQCILKNNKVTLLYPVRIRQKCYDARLISGHGAHQSCHTLGIFTQGTEDETKTVASHSPGG